MVTKTTLVLMGLALLAGCSGAVGVPGVGGQDELAECNGGAFADAIGQPADAVADRLPDGARVIPLNSAITQDYRPTRLNLDLNADGVITRLWCG